MQCISHHCCGQLVGVGKANVACIHVLVCSLAVMENLTMNYHIFILKTHFESKDVFGVSLMFQDMADFLHIMPS
jgi:hypothetical protein